MSQLGNHPYPKNSDSDSVLKSGPPPVNGIGQSNNIQYSQNGIQSPHLAGTGTGTPSSQSSRDPSRETSRDPSPTQYLRSTGLQSQYRPEWRPQMPPINGQQVSFQDPSGTSLPPQITETQEPNHASSLQDSHNFSAHQAGGGGGGGGGGGTLLSSGITSIGSQPQINSLSSAGLFFKQPKTVSISNPGNLATENKQKFETLEATPSVSQSSFNSAFKDLRVNDDSLSELNQVPNKILAQSLNQQSRSNAVQNLPNVQNLYNLQSQPNTSTQSRNLQSQSNPQKPQNLTSNLITNYKQTPHSTGFDNNQRISSQNQNFQQNLHQSQSSLQNCQASQSWPVPTSPLQSLDTNTNSTSNQLDQSNINSQNCFSNSQSVAPIQNANSAQGMLTRTQSANQTKADTNLRFFTGNQYGFSSPVQNIQNFQSVSNIPNVQNVPITSNVQNAQQPVLGGSVPPQSQHFYSSQQNLTSQAKYPHNYSYGTQLTNTNLSGPPLMSQKPPVPNLHAPTMQTRAPFTGMPPQLSIQQQQNSHDTRPPYPRQMSNVPLDNMAKRYPPSYPEQLNQPNSQVSGFGVTQAGFNKLWGNESVDLLQCRNILPSDKVEPPKIKLHQEFLDQVNCSPDIFRCTLTKIPESNSLLQKSRLPLGVLIHPFKDLYHLAVIQCSTIVRCRACRTYINPFVYFVDAKRWKCNLCYRVNELPDEFQFDPATKSYGDPSRRPEVKTSTIEFIAPSEYMLRPPQPAVYLFVLDVSRLAVESGYLNIVCKTIEEELAKMPGDGRLQVGFIAVDSAIHFFSLPDGVSQPHEMIMLDVEDVFLPCPENLIVNLKERGDLVDILLKQLPTKFQGTHDTQSALGAGIQAAYKLMAPTGGRVTVFQTCLPNLGPGALQPREDPSTRTSKKDVPNLNPITDFYKRLALDCSSQQIAIDLFLLNCQYSDLATLSGMCKFSGGCIYHLPLFRISKAQSVETLDRTLRRYLTRKIGFEAVMRIRCSRGLSIHTFHGNFFVRSTDLLSLPNVNPDAGFGMQVSIDENLSDVQNICFQAALLYTSSKGERRIRVHTLCLPVTNSLMDILYSADAQCMIGLLSKMAVDRSLQSSLSDARDALINAAIDVLSAYKISQSSPTGGLLAPENLKLLPLYIIALLKCVAFRSGMNTRLDDRIFAMCQLKTLPLSQLIQTIYPDLYAVHALDDKRVRDVDGRVCPQPSRLHLSAEKLDSRGVFLLDTGDKILIYVGKNVSPIFCSNVFGVSDFSSIPDEMYELPELPNAESERLGNFVFSLQEEKPYYVSLQIIREDSHFRTLFTERLVEDRFESALSYYEFLQHLKPQIK